MTEYHLPGCGISRWRVCSPSTRRSSCENPQENIDASESAHFVAWTPKEDASSGTAPPKTSMNGCNWRQRSETGTICSKNVLQAVPSSLKPNNRSAHWLSRSEEHTSELQSLMRISYAVFCLKKQTQQRKT